MRPIHLALVWHLHQPYYRDDASGTYALPWVRLRAVKDYRKMARILEQHPRLRQTFNLVPSLLVQLEDYAQGRADDLFGDLTRKPAGDLDRDERDTLLRWMREPSHLLRVGASSRYTELAARAADERFSVSDLRDVQVWCNLAWCDPAWCERDPRLSDLKARRRDFTEGDKDRLFAAMDEELTRVIPAYQQLMRRGQAELTFSPFAHPILPLLCDTRAACDASPDVHVPGPGFRHPDDGALQIGHGLATFQRLMKVRPRGMWPPELAVSESAARLAMDAGVDWMLADEDVLGRSIDYVLRDGDGRLRQPELLYQPWELERAGRRLSIVFRDALLSNLVGFDYQHMPAVDAARDFMARLRRIQELQGDRDFLVVVALDGENAWDYYPRDGHDFLGALYRELEEATDVVSTTVSDFLAGARFRHGLSRLHTGSWIDASLDVWIGDEEHTRAWELLGEARDAVAQQAWPGSGESIHPAWREIEIAEGSDWFWWFSRRHDSGMDQLWDDQFRLHLRNAYRNAGLAVPAALHRPLVEGPAREAWRGPDREITPRGPHDAAWHLAGRYEVEGGPCAPHGPAGPVARVLFGCDRHSLHLLVQGRREPGETLWVYLSGRPPLPGDGEARPGPLDRAGLAGLGFTPGTAVEVVGTSMTVHALETTGALRPIASMEVISGRCLSVPFAVLGRAPGEVVRMALGVTTDRRRLELAPAVGAITIVVPEDGVRAGGEGEPGLRVLIAAPELAPLADPTGLGSAVGALAAELRRQGHDARVVLPRYRGIGGALQVAVPSLPVATGDGAVSCTVLESCVGEVPAYLVDCPQLYDRPLPYGYPDDQVRFIGFSRAILEMLPTLRFDPDVIHVHGWQTALVPELLHNRYAGDPDAAATATVLTVTDLRCPERVPAAVLEAAGLSAWGQAGASSGIEPAGDTFLGHGIAYADVLSVMSPHHAREVQIHPFGEGLHELIPGHAHKLYGVTAGIDTVRFDPAGGQPHPYSAADLNGKALCRDALRRELGLDGCPEPVIALVSKLDDRHGLDLVEPILTRLVGLGLQLAVLGAGDHRYEALLRRAVLRHPGRVGVRIGFDGERARRFYAGADMALIPARQATGGGAAMVAMRYGTVPIVRGSGSLADVVDDYDPQRGQGNGFVFEGDDPWDLFAAVVRAKQSYRHAASWAQLVRRVMEEDVSWAPPAAATVQLYRRAIAVRGEERPVAQVG